MASFSIKAALAAASSLQSTNQAMSANLRDLLAGESEDGWSDEEEEEEEDFGPRERESRKRPDYSSSAWGVRLANLESLRIAGRLVPSSREAKAFRSDFRVPYEFFLHFVDLVRTIFPTATRDVAGRQCVPLELKVLGVLQVLGRGNCFADVAQLSLMSRQTAEKSFHRFCDCFSSGLWHQWVTLPEGEALKKVAGEYGDMGCPGACASLDCTHISWPSCPFSETNTHKGKEGYTTLVYEASCDHSGRILSSTKGFPGAENDKTVVKRDLSVTRMQEEEPWTSYKFVLFDLEGNTTEHTGGWLIVDGGYHRVPSLICPFKQYASEAQQEWSKRFESIRKDIECLFGRLKGRFRLFKTGIMFGTREKIDNAWFTACIIHNMLHQFDGLANLEKDMDWAGKDGEADQTTGEFPVSTAAVNTAGEEVDDGDNTEAFNLFRQQLVNHFAYKKKRGEICWFRGA